MTVTPDPRIIEGLAAQVLLLRRLESDGARLIGWKAGFGAPAALAAMALDAPLVGFLTDATRLDAGTDGTARAALSGWTRPMAEAGENSQTNSAPRPRTHSRMEGRRLASVM